MSKKIVISCDRCGTEKEYGEFEGDRFAAQDGFQYRGMGAYLCRECCEKVDDMVRRFIAGE